MGLTWVLRNSGVGKANAWYFDLVWRFHMGGYCRFACTILRVFLLKADDNDMVVYDWMGMRNGLIAVRDVCRVEDDVEMIVNVNAGCMLTALP